MAISPEPGRTGQVTSLGGVAGGVTLGRTGRDGVAVIAAATPTQFLEVNIRRVSVVVINSGANPGYVQFSSGSSNNEGVYLVPNGSLQIDELFPWTGGLWCQSALGTTLSYVEVSVQ